MIASPKIDRRGAEEIAAQVRTLVPFYLPGLRSEGGSGQLIEALTRIFARYGELTIDRLNSAPERNLLAFLNLMGISPGRPQSARVPLTFYLSAPTVFAAIVPAGTQVAAELAKGEQKPVVFETETELVVVAVRLESLFVKNIEQDTYRNWKAVIGPSTPPSSAPAPSSVDIATAAPTQLIPHLMYVGLPSLLHLPNNNLVRLRFQLQELGVAFHDTRSVQWELCEGVSEQPRAPNAPEGNGEEEPEKFLVTPISPENDQTENLTKSGEIEFRNLHQPKAAKVEGILGSWIRCRLLTPITRSAAPVPGMVRESHLPRIDETRIETEFELNALPIQTAFANNSKVDVSKDFFPFGERPKFGDTLLLASDAFSYPDGGVTIQIELTNPSGASDSPLPPVAGQNTKLRWEYWDGQEWVALGTGELTPPVRRVHIHRETPGELPETQAETEFVDNTRALTDSGTVSFRFTRPPAPSTVNGQKGYWLRVRIVAGDYGREALYERDEQGAYMLTPATFAPPSIRSIKVECVVESESEPEALIVCNDSVCQEVQSRETFQPFSPAAVEEDPPPSVYFGFAPPVLPPGANPMPVALGVRSLFPSRSLSLYVGVKGEGPKHEDPRSFDQTTVVASWEYWNGSIWKKWTVRDDTQGLERSGMIRILAPVDYQPRKEFGLTRYWLRMRKGAAHFDPQLTCTLLNTTMAREGATMGGEILGSSNGRPNQKFRATQPSILAGQQLEVREPTPPTKEERIGIAKEEGADAIRRIPATETSPEQIWVRWHEVPNFLASKPRDRHYVLNWLSGEIQFGDGVNGQIPPGMPGNIRMATYRTGGGAAGNKLAFTIKQLKSAVPYIDKVLNWEAAGGGGDAESVSDIANRGPRVLRHGNRAVTREDFEDLALMASSQVARAKCVPLRDLQDARPVSTPQLGVISIIIVPRSSDPRPMPNAELLDCVRSFLLSSSLPVVRLVLVDPEYVPIDLEAEIAVDDYDTATETELAVTRALQNYLHPVVGGRDRIGWEFGREPLKSDLYGVIEEVPGVSHVRSLKLLARPGAKRDEKSDHFLICGGDIKVATTLQE